MLIDDLIGFFSPEAGNKRYIHRQAAKLNKRKFEGAARGRRVKNWHTSSGNANADARPALQILRQRARDLVRNDPYAAKSQQVIANNVVGKGVMPQLPDGDLATLWKKWSKTPACDFNGILNFASMQRLAMGSVFTSGEILARKRIVTGEDFPLKIQLLESDHLIIDETNFNNPTKNRIVQGVEVDSDDRPVAYHLYKTHPGASGDEQTTADFEIVRLALEEVAHVYRMDRPGQMRGISWLHPVLLLLRDFNELQDAQLLKQKVSALFAGFIKSLDDDGFQGDDEENEDEITLEAGGMQKLPSGMDISFTNPPSVENYKEYTSCLLHAISSGLGITFESMTGDLSEVNFSSARMGWLEMNRNLDAWRDSVLNTGFNAKVFGWFLESAKLAGVSVPSADFVPSWTSPKREMIDPTKEIPAKVKAIRAGLTTLSEAIRESGKHPDEHLAEYKDDMDKLASLGLSLDSDASKKALDGDNLTEEVNANEETK
jgi:lambda family phage portal protein